MRKNLRTVGLALLCVLAIGLAAATLGSPVDPGDGGGSGSGGGGTGTGAGDSPNLDLPSANNGTGAGNQPQSQWQYCYEPLDGQPFYAPLVGVPLAVGLVVGLIYDRNRGALAAMLVFWPAVILVLLLTAGCDPPPTQQAGGEVLNATAEAVSGSDEGGGDRTFTTPVSLLIILLVVAAVGLFAAVLLRGDGDESEAPRPPQMDDQQRQAHIGSAAGDAADRIEDDAAVENEVYRAWAEMAEPLPVDRPETSTPAEFAAAATEAGIRRDDVDELTTLFEEVRYGTADATAEREQRAVAALRRIERHYADANGGGYSGSDSAGRSGSDPANWSDPGG